jgi:hypothetical protein
LASSKRIFPESSDVTSLLRVYAISVTKMKPFFADFTRVIWTQVQNMRMFSAIVCMSDILDLSELKEAAVLVVESNGWLNDEPGTVDFWPDREFLGEKWVASPRWASKGVRDILSCVKAEMSVNSWGAAEWFGKEALRVVVPAAAYTKVEKFAVANKLQFRRVTPPNISTAKLSVKVISGSDDRLPLATFYARQMVEKELMGSSVAWGRQELCPGAVEVIVFTTKKVVASDAFSAFEEGIRVSFTPFLTSVGALPQAEIDEKLSTLSVPSATAQQTADCPAMGAEGGDDIDDEVMAALRKVELENAHNSRAKSIKKMVVSWSVLNLPKEVVASALGAVIDVAKESDDHDPDVSLVEETAAWVNLCPTPSEVLNKLGASNHVNELRNLLELAPPVPKVKTIEGAPKANQRPTFSQAARGGGRGTRAGRGGRG